MCFLGHFGNRVHEDSSLPFGFSHYVASTTRVGLEGHSVNELFVGADPETQQCTATACWVGCIISGNPSFGSSRGSLLGAWTSLAPLLCSACWYMSARPSLAVPASWRRNRDLCVFSVVLSLSLSVRVAPHVCYAHAQTAFAPALCWTVEPDLLGMHDGSTRPQFCHVGMFAVVRCVFDEFFSTMLFSLTLRTVVCWSFPGLASVTFVCRSFPTLR